MNQPPEDARIEIEAKAEQWKSGAKVKYVNISQHREFTPDQSFSPIRLTEHAFNCLAKAPNGEELRIAEWNQLGIHWFWNPDF